MRVRANAALSVSLAREGGRVFPVGPTHPADGSNHSNARARAVVAVRAHEVSRSASASQRCMTTSQQMVSCLTT